jgi:hypothetical protein
MAIPKRKTLPVDEVHTSSLDAFARSFRALLDDQEKHPEKYAFLGETTMGNPISLGPRVISGADWAAKQTARAAAAADTWLAGVQRPRKNPVEAALQANAKRKDKLAQAEKAGKWEKAMAKVNIDEMQQTIKNVGSAAYANGISARAGKINRVYNELQPMVATLAAAIDAMPQATDTDREKRLLAARKGMIEIGNKRTG